MGKSKAFGVQINWFQVYLDSILAQWRIQGGVRGVQMHPPLAARNFCVHNCTTPSNDYAAVACSNNNQAQFTDVSVPYRRLTRPRDTQFVLPAILYNALACYQSVATIITCVTNALITRRGRGNPKTFGFASCAHG